ncbi:hypothetical protein Patl1_24994 [Pistacia atlantica]|uniref:Uncharacterized protein n=1 Tax=Pistacia atlantica TaxID=434234 RepID=A0ACC1B189_9ROSI|nr:hypothetical protein Patl1_24994 [Pistacia atlantica]
MCITHMSRISSSFTRTNVKCVNSYKCLRIIPKKILQSLSIP